MGIKIQLEKNKFLSALTVAKERCLMYDPNSKLERLQSALKAVKQSECSIRAMCFPMLYEIITTTSDRDVIREVLEEAIAKEEKK
jgi:hypothetical protein